MKAEYKEVIEANIKLHTRLASEYNTCEPQFKAENIDRTEKILSELINKTNAKSILDLGCGTGFVIDIAKKYVSEIYGVDVTQAMLDRIDLSGSANIKVFNHDAGTFSAGDKKFDMVTAYSFLHHLYEIRPVLETAYKHLNSGGVFYADQDPNFYFWESVNKLDRNGDYHEVVKREIEMVSYKDEDIQEKFGIETDIFNKAEYGKNIRGGFKEEEIREMLLEIGFKKVDFVYYWYIGQAMVINQLGFTKELGLQKADFIDEVLQKILPISKNLYKYIGFIATK
jgi:ubiquinone/menaquinone biosynthesis C-methylase UbiE